MAKADSWITEVRLADRPSEMLARITWPRRHAWNGLAYDGHPFD
ncbi:hypothetical protein [Nonomuraea sp. NPDC005650]